MTSSKFILPLSCLAGGLLFAATSAAYAGGLDEIQPKITRSERGVEFTVTCDPDGGGGSVSTSWRQDQRFLAPYKFTPRCMMMGNERGGTYLCKCVDDGSSILGEVEGSEIFPDGKIPDDTKPGPDAFDLIFDTCRDVLQHHCGPFPEDLSVDCISEHGWCGVDAQVGDADGEFDALLSGCGCALGHGWETFDVFKASQTLTQEAASEFCQAELKNCAPDGTQGPSENELFGIELLQSRSTSCADVKEDGAPGRPRAICFLTSDGTSGSYECYAGEQEFSGTYDVQGLETRAKMHARCLEVLDGLDIPQPKPGEGEGGLPDILDKLGCTLAPQGAASPWLLALFGLIFGLRRRQTPTRG